MNEVLLNHISGFSVSIPAIAGCYRYKKVDRIFHPFLWLLMLAFLNETLSFFITKAGYSNAINANIYSLTESFMITMFFKRFGLFDRWVQLYYAFLILFVLVWVADNFIISSIREFSSYFTITTSFSYVLMSISMINRLIVAGTKTILSNPVFLVSMGFVLFFTYALLIEIFWVYGLSSSREFQRHLYRIMTFINLAVNLIYAIAVLWIPRKREYTLL